VLNIDYMMVVVVVVVVVVVGVGVVDHMMVMLVLGLV
jgi:hypothetical protein